MKPRTQKELLAAATLALLDRDAERIEELAAQISGWMVDRETTDTLAELLSAMADAAYEMEDQDDDDDE